MKEKSPRIELKILVPGEPGMNLTYLGFWGSSTHAGKILEVHGLVLVSQNCILASKKSDVPNPVPTNPKANNPSAATLIPIISPSPQT
ncbi:MAG: hypothetical protein DSM106950_45995 [Stigonema ocellatum SAG 48.90 = DSM 106950]|nr:hypothetical protein [Stigonema ocellatum SAG 48.90 = DSM 106950]